MRFLAALFTLLASVLTPAWAQNAPFPPSPKQLVAVNPVTNKVYVANEFANTVTVLDQTNNTTATIPVGNRPQFIVVNPLTNRVFVNNGGEASVTVIDGATDTNITPTPLQVGSQGPMAINNETNVVFIVRMTSVATDEVTFLNATNNTWYTIATESFQPTAVTINPVTNTLYVAHYGTGDVRVISGEYNNTNLHPQTFSIPAWSKPFAIAANSMTNRIYVITEDSRGPIGVINGATNVATWLTPAAGHASGPKALAVNPVTNKIYAAFANEVVVIDGGNNSLAYVPVPTGSVASIAINHFTNKVYVSSDGGNLTVIDGFTNATTALTVPGGTISIGMNPMTNEIITGGSTAAAVDGVAAPFIGLPLTTTITPLPGNAGTTSGSITMSASNGFPNPLPVRGVYYQFDSIEGRWSLASGAGNGPWTAALSGLSSGSHTIYAFAAEAHMAPTDTGNGSSPMFGNITSYAFSVTGAAGTATVGVASSVNPSTSGQSVTFTATVTGSSGTPTGTVTFLDGSTPLCSAVALASGSATCTTTALTAGSHTINANYSGNSSYGTASGSVTQTVNKLAASVSLGSTPNPSTAGQSVTITATVTGSGATPTGTVTFLDGTTTLCAAVALASGSATCTTSSLSTGAHTLNANYSGNATYNTASGTTTQNVGTATATVGVASSVNPSTVGQSVTFTATVGGSTGTPTGTVTFSDGATTLCSAVALAFGSAACTMSALAAGDHTITAAYSGSATYGAKSATLAQTVNTPAPAKSEITSPVPGSKLGGSSVTFTWSSGSQVTARYLEVGSTLGGSDYFAGYVEGVSRTVTGLPTDGRTIYVRLRSFLNGDWAFNSYTYEAAGSVAVAQSSEITSPTPGSKLAGGTVTFTWNAGNQVTARYLEVGSTAGGSDYYAAYQDSLSRTVSGLPTDGRTIYVRLRSFINGDWALKSYTYEAAGSAVPSDEPAPSLITSPASGSTLGSSTVTFNWTPGTSVTARYLTVGSSPGGSDIYAAYQDAGATSKTLSGIPTNMPVYVRLYSWIGGGWVTVDYGYNGAIVASSLIAPANNSKLASTSATFKWSEGAGVTAHYLMVGTTMGGSELYAGYQDQATRTVTGLPADGRTIYARLMSWTGSGWIYFDYAYLAAGP